MTIKDYKCKCGHNDFFFTDKGSQKGIYCSFCGKWLKWADKDEQNLAMKQEPILDKIRAEIAELSHYYPMGHDYQIAITRCIAVIDKNEAEREELWKIEK